MQDDNQETAVTPSSSDDAGASRRKFLKGGMALTAGTLAAGFPMISTAAKPVVLKLQGAWGGGIFKEFALDYVRRVNEMSGGSLKVDYLDVGAVVKTAEIQTAVHRGVIDGSHLVTAYWYSKNPAASLFGTGPCWGWTANQLLGWIHYGGGKALYEELMRDVLKLDIVGFFSGPMPAQPLGWFRKEVNGVEDMKGLKYRTVGLAANVMMEMGMSVVQLPGGEIQPAMDRGLIDAAEFNNPTSDKDFGMQDVAKNYYLASFHQSQECFEIIFNKKKFESLAEEHKKILQYAAEAARPTCPGKRRTATPAICRPCRKSMGLRSAAPRSRLWTNSSRPGTRYCPSSRKIPSSPRSSNRRRPG
jgi:TRAP-type mannitol/chloroaromatic compound transport system substrate-binding protein